MGIDQIMRRYILEFECSSILAKAHGGVEGGHYTGRVTMQKTFHTRLWWITMHKDYKAYSKACDACQRIRKPLDKTKNEFGLVKKSRKHSIHSITD